MVKLSIRVSYYTLQINFTLAKKNYNAYLIGKSCFSFCISNIVNPYLISSAITKGVTIMGPLAIFPLCLTLEEWYLKTMTVTLVPTTLQEEQDVGMLETSRNPQYTGRGIWGGSDNFF